MERAHTHKQVSYATDAFVFDVKKLLLCELHLQEVLEDQSVTKHSILQSKGKKTLLRQSHQHIHTR